MVQKVLPLVLVLLWTMPVFMAKHNMKAKYITKQKLNYREEDEISHAQNSYAVSIKLIRTMQLIYLDQRKIPAYNIDGNRKMK